MGEFLDVFFGTPQSLYASYAIIAAIITICITIMLTGTEIPFANRFLFIFLTILMLLPSVFLVLFQITCMVTGGTKDTRWWCWLYAWIVSAFVIIYCVFVIIISFSSLFTYTNAMSKVEVQDATNKVSPEVSNAYAKKVMVENFANNEYQEPSNLNINDSGKIADVNPTNQNTEKADKKKIDKFININDIQKQLANSTGLNLLQPTNASEEPKMNLISNFANQYANEYPGPLTEDQKQKLPVPREGFESVHGNIGTPKEEKETKNKQPVTVDTNPPHVSNDDGTLAKFIGNFQLDEGFGNIEAFTNMDESKYSLF